MTVTLRTCLAACGLSVGLAIAGTAQANDIEDAIHYRQSALSVIGWQLGPLGAMAQGDIDYDAEEFAYRAENLAFLVSLPWEGFVEGSLRDDGHGVDTDALAAIADDWEDFESRQQTLIEQTATLAELAQGDDFAAMRQQVADVAQTCRGCHDNYRAD